MHDGEAGMQRAASVLACRTVERPIRIEGADKDRVVTRSSKATTKRIRLEALHM